MKKSIVFVLAVLVCASGLVGCASTGGGEYREIPNAVFKDASSYKVGTKIKTTIQFQGRYELTITNGTTTIPIYRIFKNEYLEKDFPRLIDRIEPNKDYTVYLTVRNLFEGKLDHFFMGEAYNQGYYYTLDRIEGLKPLEELMAAEEAARAAKKEKEEAERQAREKAAAEKKAEEEQKKQAEQTRLAGLYRQAGNNFGNLKNTTKRNRQPSFIGYLTTVYDFGDGEYIVEKLLDDGSSWSKSTGTFRVNGNSIIFLSSGGAYSIGTITGNTLTIDGYVYR